jgi:hypothetical protein
MISRDGTETGVEVRVIRGLSVMLDVDLARLYGVTTGTLLDAVRRTPDTSPETLCFRLLPKRLRL